MNIKSLITTFSILTATSSAALADASFSVHAQGGVTISGTSDTRVYYGNGPTVRDHRDAKPVRPIKPAPPRVVPVHPRPMAPRPEPQLQISMPRVVVEQNASWYEGTLGSTHARPGMVALTQPTRLDSRVIREGFKLEAAGMIDKVQLNALRGSTTIDMIGVLYANGEKEFIQVNRTIDSRSPLTFVIDLKGGARQVSILNVYGKSTADAAFQLYASS